ncbi:unnamed protein product [Thelazia callipaeda]|uniref:BHLH domain-containing protein n=1 Tax=Thelazia callipaeda TaxID=103827 RepID=A0A0N5D4I6_THECL|nr:unnamed protein product [Thelazia callipaeda]
MRMPNGFDAISNTATSSNGSSPRIRVRKLKSGGVTTKLPHQVLRRNERERKRVQQVNLGFIHLRDRVPHSATSKKLSKVETLREAARYIKHLQDLLQGTCDKPFEPLNINHETRNNHNNLCLTQENHNPSLDQQTNSSCHYACSTEPVYNHFNFTDHPYYKSQNSFNFHNSTLKSENELLHSTSVYSSTSTASPFSCNEITRFQHTDYVL